MAKGGKFLFPGEFQRIAARRFLGGVLLDGVDGATLAQVWVLLFYMSGMSGHVDRATDAANAGRPHA